MPVARTPLRSLEEIKALLQKLSRPRFSLSPVQDGLNPPSLTKKLFSRRRSTSADPSPTTPSYTPHLSLTPSPTSTLKPHVHTELLTEEGEEDEYEDNKEEEEQLLYEAESPDEAALVQAAKAYGCTLLGRSPEQLLVSLPGIGPLSVPLLHLLPFDSTRKRMSVVVQHPLTGQVVVYTKGADNVIMELADAGV